ncbi:MAG: hypothetical protein ACRDNW_14370 [Trebonia sp.]
MRFTPMTMALTTGHNTMTKPPRHTDLAATEGAPTPRGDPTVQCFEAEARLKALALRFKTRTGEWSPTGVAVAVLLLTVSGVACAIAVHAVGAPEWTEPVALLLPVAVYWLIMRGGRGTTR